MHQIIVRLLLAALTFTSIILLAGCPDEDMTPVTVIPGPGESQTLGKDQAVIDACIQGCEALVTAVECSKSAHLREDANTCKAACPGQTVSIAKACREDALMAYQCQATAKWTCGNSTEAALATHECEAEIGAYRQCILAH